MKTSTLFWASDSAVPPHEQDGLFYFDQRYYSFRAAFSKDYLYYEVTQLRGALEFELKRNRSSVMNPPQALISDLKLKLNLAWFSQWIDTGRLKVLGGPTSDEISDFSNHTTPQEIESILAGKSAKYLHFNPSEVLRVLHQRFPAWQGENTFAFFVVMTVIRTLQRELYPQIAAALFELSKKEANLPEIITICQELDALNAKVGSNFFVFYNQLDPSLQRYFRFQSNQQLLKWIGVGGFMVSGLLLMLHYGSIITIDGSHWRYGAIGVEAFWVLGALSLFIVFGNFLSNRRS